MDFNDMIDQLGREVVSTRPRCATLALGTLKAAITQYRKNKIQAELEAEA
jgi:nitrogen fixation NifU-like protein